MYIENSHQARNTVHSTKLYFRCHQCEQPKVCQSNGGTGYATTNAGYLICYECCAVNDIEWMRTKGEITLYITESNGIFFVSNWPGTLQIQCTANSIGRHNIAGKRQDVWFPFNGFIWHGIHYGVNTQLVHCKKTNSPIRETGSHL